MMEEVRLPRVKQDDKFIHQIWFNFNKNSKDPKKVAKGKHPNKKSLRLQKKCKELNPDWTHVLWSEEMCESLISRFYSWFLPVYKEYPHPVQRVDAARYFILFTYGGFYIDMDVECLQSFTKARGRYPNDVYFVESPNCLMGKGVSNSIIYCKRENRFMEDVIMSLEGAAIQSWYQSKHSFIMFSTGPSFINSVVSSSNTEISLLPSKYFNPFGLCDTVDPNYKSNKELFTVHHNFGSWESDDSWYLKVLFCNLRVIIVTVVVVLVLIFLMKRMKE